MVQGFIFEGDLQVSKLFKNTICKGVCTVKCNEKRFIPFTPPPFSSLMCPLWRAASLRSAPHQQTPEPVYIVVDKLVHCDPNMYS